MPSPPLVRISSVATSINAAHSLFYRTYPCATAAIMPCIASGTASKAETADGQSRSQPASTEAAAIA
jgi:hypothetical protein